MARLTPEQRGVVGLFSLDSEVVDGADNAFAEVPEPDAIDDIASGEGIVRAGDGLGHLEAAAAVLERLRWLG